MRQRLDGTKGTAGSRGARLERGALAALYAFTARQLSASSYLDDFRDQLTSPLGIAVQLLVIIGLILLMQVDWTRWVKSQRRP